MFGLSFLTMIAVATVLFFNSCEQDPCKDVICVNGTCVSGICDCDAGYEGSDCGTESRAQFIGTYSVSGTVACEVTPDGTITNAVLSITNSASDVTKIVINFAGQLTIIGTVTGSSVTIESQTVGSFTYTGNGTVSGNNITMTLNEFDPSIPETCIYNFSGPKQ